MTAPAENVQAATSGLVDVRPAHVVLIANDDEVRLALEAAVPSWISCRSHTTTAEVDGDHCDVVIIGSDFPISEVDEMRVHPYGESKPIVVFAPGKVLPALDWDAIGVWPITNVDDAIGELIALLGRLLTSPER